MHIKYIILALADVIAIIELVWPKTVWQLTRWQYKAPAPVEPSTAVVIVIRIVAAIVLVVGNAMLIPRA